MARETTKTTSGQPASSVPPAIMQSLLASPPAPPVAQAVGGMAGAMPSLASPAPMMQPQQRPAYQAGGMVGPGGQPMRPPGMAMPGQMNPGASQQSMLSPQVLEAEAERVIRENPQAVEQVRQQLVAAMQQGMITEEELRLSVQMAKVALRNPNMYPQLRALAIERGIATPDSISPEYDPGYLFLIIMGGEAALSGQSAPANPAAPSMKDGGPLPERSPNRDGTIPINAHEGEYVIPKHVVRAKGTEFFDKLLQQYESSGDANS